MSAPPVKAKTLASTLLTDTAGLLDEEQLRARIRELAVSLGHEPDRVVAQFEKAGPLADFVRAILGGRPRVKRKRGPKPKAETWRSFEAVTAKRAAGVRREDAIAEHAEATGKTEDAVRSGYDHWRKRNVFG